MLIEDTEYLRFENNCFSRGQNCKPFSFSCNLSAFMSHFQCLHIHRHYVICSGKIIVSPPFRVRMCPYAYVCQESFQRPLIPKFKILCSTKYYDDDNISLLTLQLPVQLHSNFEYLLRSC